MTDPSAKDDEAELRCLMKRYDPAILPASIDLAALEERIMARVDGLPERTFAVASGFFLATWSQSFAARIMVAAVLFVMLGFVAGRDLSEFLSGTAGQAVLYASADDTVWQSFVTLSLPSGESDDTDE